MSAQADQITATSRSILARVLLGLIALYRVSLGLVVGGSCRFEPSCSRYAQIAVQRHGAWQGSKYTLRRLLSCHPWHAGGLDQVPSCTLRVSGPRHRSRITKVFRGLV